MPHFDRVAIIGLGMIGASLARALKKHTLAGHVVGCGRGKENLEFALSEGYVDSITQSTAEAAKDADLIVLASPVETFGQIAMALAPSLKPGALVMDVGSVKGELVSSLQSLMPDKVEFVGCHPIAGSELAGASASVDGLFDGAQCLITPTNNNSDETVSNIASLWDTLGSRVRMMDPMEHDELLGLVSHFPHLAAYAMINAIEDRVEGAVSLSGAGLKDTTRIAMSPAKLWRDISMMNRDNIIPAIEGYINELNTIKDALKSDDSDTLEARLALAEKRRRSVNEG